MRTKLYNSIQTAIDDYSIAVCTEQHTFDCTILKMQSLVCN